MAPTTCPQVGFFLVALAFFRTILDAPLDERRGLDVGDEFGSSFDLPRQGEDRGVVSSPLSASRTGPEMVNGVGGLCKFSPCLEGVVSPVTSLKGELARICGASCSSSP